VQKCASEEGTSVRYGIERTHVEFRAEFFNITNHPNFSIPVPGSSATDFRAPDFGQITYTRDSPNDPRQIQFALKFYW